MVPDKEQELCVCYDDDVTLSYQCDKLYYVYVSNFLNSPLKWGGQIFILSLLYKYSPKKICFAKGLRIQT